jgi:serine phosphatase RsbU (regulator of sigma subunit)
VHTRVKRAAELLHEHEQRIYVRTDHMFAVLMVVQWIAGVAAALWITPRTWIGATSEIHLHVWAAIFLGGAISLFPVSLALLYPGRTLTRHVIAAGQVLTSALLILLTGGRIETHFHVFGSLAFLAFYRDWRVLVPATVIVAADHLVRQLVYPESVYGLSNPEWWRFLEHAFWVVFEDAFLVIACVRGVREMRDLAQQQARIELSEQLETEMEIASTIQTAILPKEPAVAGLDITAAMVAAAEVGGDYYDVLPVDDGCWLGIGDVAGHGLVAGLVMMQTQSAIRALVHQNPNRSPRDLLSDVNHVLYENVRSRMNQDEHMTLSLVRYHEDGRVVVAGAHQSIVICRAATGRCERHKATGTWLGLVEDIRPFTVESTYELGEGDLLVLFTDGITEAMNDGEEQFGLDRLCEAVEAYHQLPVADIQAKLLARVSAWSRRHQEDDVTLIVLRRAPLKEARAA